jgi:hypothetical protein
LGTIWLGWFQTTIFLISASWVASRCELTGMSHQHSAKNKPLWPSRLANKE